MEHPRTPGVRGCSMEASTPGCPRRGEIMAEWTYSVANQPENRGIHLTMHLCSH